jgi:hypothetical protein
MHARFNSPLTGRFLATDPVGGKAGAPQSWNRYSYARANPLKFVDPNGEDVVFFARDDAGGGATNFGHAAVRVVGDGYDMTYDFGRYRGGHGLLSRTGPGILKVWTDFAAFVATQQGKGNSAAVQFDTTEAFDKAVMSYFSKQFTASEQIESAGNYTAYQLADDYDLETNNCTTMSLAGVGAGASAAASPQDIAAKQYLLGFHSQAYVTSKLGSSAIDPRKIFAHIDASRSSSPQGMTIYYFSYTAPKN